jgi:hypothetical protein
MSRKIIYGTFFWENFWRGCRKRCGEDEYFVVGKNGISFRVALRPKGGNRLHHFLANFPCFKLSSPFRLEKETRLQTKKYGEAFLISNGFKRKSRDQNAFFIHL